jgi:hypothetical protein
MNVRIAKKVFKNPERYTGQQRYAAAHRLYRYASTFKDGEVGFWALKLKPQRSFHADDTLDLRLEYFLAKYDALEPIDFPPGEVVVPQEGINKPMYRRDGQAGNLNALPFPGSWGYKQKVVVVEEEVVVVNELVGVETKKTWEMGEWRVERPYSRKKYQIRTGGKMAGVKPSRLKRV